MGIFRLFEGPENAPFWLKKGILYFKILFGFFFFLGGGMLPLQLIPASFQDKNPESSAPSHCRHVPTFPSLGVTMGVSLYARVG